MRRQPPPLDAPGSLDCDGAGFASSQLVIADRRPAQPGSGPPSNLVDERLFKFLVDLEVEKAGRLQYCVSVVCLSPQGPGEAADPALAQRAAEVASRAFRSTDVVSALSPMMVCLLLVDAETRDLPQIFHRTTAELGAHALTAAPSGERIAWTAGGSCYPLTAMTGSELIRQAADLTGRAGRGGSGALHLPE